MEHYKNIHIKYTKYKKNITKNDNVIIVVERSAYSAIFTFCKMYLKNNKLSKEQYNNLLTDASKYELPYDIRIFIDTNVQECHRRVKERNRKCDRDIPLEKLQFLDMLYQQMYADDEKSEPDISKFLNKRMKVNGMCGKDTVFQEVTKIIFQTNDSIRNVKVNQSTLYHYYNDTEVSTIKKKQKSEKKNNNK